MLECRELLENIILFYPKDKQRFIYLDLSYTHVSSKFFASCLSTLIYLQTIKLRNCQQSFETLFKVLFTQYYNPKETIDISENPLKNESIIKNAIITKRELEGTGYSPAKTKSAQFDESLVKTLPSAKNMPQQIYDDTDFSFANSVHIEHLWIGTDDD